MVIRGQGALFQVCKPIGPQPTLVGVWLYPIGQGAQPANNGCDPCSQPTQGQWTQWGAWGQCQNNVYGGRLINTQNSSPLFH